MASPTVIQGDMFVNGNFQANSQTLPDASVTDIKVKQPTGGGTSMGTDFIDKDKVQQLFSRTLSQAHGFAASTERKPIHIARGPGIVEQVTAQVMVACIGAATIDILLKKNGSTNVLSATLTIDNGDVAFDKVLGTIDPGADNYVDGDVFDLTVTATAGGGTLGQGLLVQVVFREDPFA